MSDDPNKLVEISGDEKTLLVERKATCPFIGSAVAQGKLLVRNDAKDPLASIETSEGWVIPAAVILETCWCCLRAAIMRSCWVTLESWTSEHRGACFH